MISGLESSLKTPGCALGREPGRADLSDWGRSGDRLGREKGKQVPPLGGTLPEEPVKGPRTGFAAVAAPFGKKGLLDGSTSSTRDDTCFWKRRRPRLPVEDRRGPLGRVSASFKCFHQSNIQEVASDSARPLNSDRRESVGALGSQHESRVGRSREKSWL